MARVTWVYLVPWRRGHVPAAIRPLGLAPWVEAMARGLLDATALGGRGVFHQGDQAGRHEPPGPHRLAGARHLPHLHDTACRHDLDAAAGARGDDVEGLRALPGIDYRLDPIAFHASNDTPGRRTRRDGVLPALRIEQNC